jgi:pimeloyl-ACP methyl ester carboxylesterase
MPLPYRRHAVETPDGHALGLFRLEVAGQPSHLCASAAAPSEAPLRPPVLLLPGMGANRFTFCVRPGEGLPWRLSQDGWDVWLGELRGARTSGPSSGSAPGSSGPARGRQTPAAKLEHDVPALISAVRAASGSPRVALVGHSLGGLLSLLTAGRAADGGLSEVLAVVTLCAPLFSGAPRARGPVTALLGALSSHGLPRGAIPVGPLAAATRLGAPLFAPRSHFLPGGSDPEVLRAYFSSAVEDIGIEEAVALLGWRLTGHLSLTQEYVTDKAFNRTSSIASVLRGVRVPVLSLAAYQDRVVPPDAALRAFEAVGSDDKTWLPLGRAHGSRAEYAHADVLLGRHANADVFDPVCAWLSRVRDRRQNAPIS